MKGGGWVAAGKKEREARVGRRPGSGGEGGEGGPGVEEVRLRWGRREREAGCGGGRVVAGREEREARVGRRRRREREEELG